MPFIPESKIRLEQASEISVSENSGVSMFEWDFFKRPLDAAMELQIDVVSGSVGVRFDAESTDRVSITDSTATVFSIDDLTDTKHTIKLISLASPTQIDFFQLYVIGGG